MTLDKLQALGFDASAHAFGRVNLLSVACSQCQALVINGTATHERGCRNAMRECNGCSAFIPARQRYCEDCQ